MRYTKPTIITTVEASTQIRGTDPAMGKGHVNTFDSQNVIQKTTVPAYESDE